MHVVGFDGHGVSIPASCCYGNSVSWSALPDITALLSSAAPPAPSSSLAPSSSVSLFSVSLRTIFSCSFSVVEALAAKYTRLLCSGPSDASSSFLRALRQSRTAQRPALRYGFAQATTAQRQVGEQSSPTNASRALRHHNDKLKPGGMMQTKLDYSLLNRHLRPGRPSRQQHLTPRRNRLGQMQRLPNLQIPPLRRRCGPLLLLLLVPSSSRNDVRNDSIALLRLRVKDDQALDLVDRPPQPSLLDHRARHRFCCRGTEGEEEA